MSEWKDSALYPMGIALSDRIGRFANDDGWFDSVVESCSVGDGDRLYVSELTDLGRKVIEELGAGRDVVPIAVLREVELVLRDRDLDPADLAPYLVEAMDAELLDLKRGDPPRFVAIQAKLRNLMGPKSKQLWSLMSSSK